MRYQANLNDIRAFAIAAQRGSLTAAAAELGQPVSTVSRAISRIEKHLRVSLMRRGARGLALTDEGAAYLPVCRRALRVLREGELQLESHRSSPSGIVRIACPITFAREILTPLLPELLHQYPEIRLQIEPYTSNWDQEPREGVDLFFKVRAPRDSQRHVRAFPGTARGLFATKTYLERAGMPRTPEELERHSCTGSGIFFRLTKGARIAMPSIPFRVDTSDPWVNLGFVQQHLGIAALPRYMAKWPENREAFVPVLPAWRPDPIVLCALFTGNSRLTPKVHVLLEFLAQYIGTERDPRLKKQPASKDDFTERALSRSFRP